MSTDKCSDYFIVILTQIILLMLPPLVSGDLVEFEDGSNIFGKITKIKDGKIFVETLFAGEITAEQDQVAGLFIEDQVHIALKDGLQLFGEVAIEPELSNSSIAGKDFKVDISKIKSIWREGDDPVSVKIEEITTPQKKSKWKWNASVNVAGRTGNTETLATSGRIATTLVGAEDQLKLYFRLDQAETNQNKTSDEYKGGVDFEAGFPANHSGFIRAEAEYDEVEAIKLRLTAATGYGYYLLKTDYRQLRGRIGLQFLHEEFIDNGSKNDPGLELGLFNLYKINERVKLTTDITHLQIFDDISNFRSVHESSMEFPLDSNQQWKVRLGVLNEFDNQPAKNRVRLDTRFFINFILSWEQPYLIYLDTN